MKQNDTPLGRVAIPAIMTLASLAATPVWAVDYTWTGLNAFSDPDSGATDINDGANWTDGSTTGTVPGVGDTAIINFVGGNDTSLKGDLFIDSGDTDFNPSALIFNSNVNPDSWRQSSDLYLDKSLDLSGGFTFSGYGSGGGSGQQQSRFRIGTQALGVSIDIGSWTMNNNSPGWAWFNFGTGDGTPGNAPEFNFTGSSITFNSPNNDLSQSINGGTSSEDALLAVNPRWNFTNTGGSIHLEQGANRTTGTIGLGQVHLNVRSDQTWTADPLAFISMSGSAGSGGNSGKFIVGSIDGGRLDNMSQVNLKVTGTTSSAGLSTAMQFVGGTYGSFWQQGDGNTVSRSQAVKMNDDVAFTGSVVMFDGDGEAYASNYGMALTQVASSGGSATTDDQNFYTQGNALDITNGLLFDDQSLTTKPGRNLKVLAEGSNVSIGGDVMMTGDASKLPGGTDVNNNIALDGGATGANVTLGGSWIVQTVSANGSSNDYNLSASTLTMNGGDGVAAETFEVGDASSTTGVQAQTWSVGTFNVGVDAGDTANLQLVNDYLNNNPFVSDPNVDKVGEKLIAGALNIRENSTLDANLGVAAVEVADLLLETGAVLDLNTNIALSDGQLIDDFVGLGDQTGDWAGFASQVTDSSNPLFAFNPIYQGGTDTTVWQASLVPEPGTWALMAGLAGLGLCLWRRRR